MSRCPAQVAAMDDEHPSIEPFVVGVPGLPGADIGSPGDVLTYLGPNFVPKFRPVTGAGLGNVTGPATTTVDFVPQWSNTSGTLLKNGLPVSTTGAALSLVETGAGGKIAASVIPDSGVTAGTYTYTQLTVGADGRLTAASSGAAPGITADAPAGPTVYGRNTGSWVPAVPLAGGTMTGPLVLSSSAAPATAAGAAPKGYVDGLVAGLAPLLSPFFTGTPTAPNQVSSDDSTRLATTHFVKSQGYTTAAGVSMTLVGDITGGGSSPITTTLAMVNTTVGTYQGLTVNAKGLVTGAVDQNYATSAALAGYLPLSGGTITNISGAPDTLVIQRNTAPPPPTIPVTAFRINFGDNEPGYVILDGYGIYPNLTFRTSNGTGAAPLYNEENEILGVITARGYDGGAYSVLGAGRISFWTLEDFTATAQGTAIKIETNPVGSTTRALQATFGPGLAVGAAPTPPAGGMLNGDINAAGRIMINGVPLATTGGVAGAYLPLSGGTITGTAPGTLYIQRGAAMPAAPAQVNPILWLAGRNTGGALGAGEVATLIVDAINELPGVLLRRANGTGASAVAAGDILGQIAVRGYGATQYSPGGNARLQFRAAETFTDNFQGTTIRLQTTPVGDNVLHDQLIVGPGLTVGTPTPPADGMHIGDGNFSRILLNGIAIASTGGGGGLTTLAGDVTGASTATTVVRLQGRNIATTAPLSSQVLAWNATSSWWEPTPAVTGSGGPPGGTTGSIQINVGGSFGGIVMSGDATWNTTTGALSLATPYLPLAGGTISGTAPGSITINRGSTMLGAPTATVLRAIGNTGEDPAIILDGFGGAGSPDPALTMRHARGSGATPTNTLSGDILGHLGWRGYGTGYSPVGVARIEAVAAQDFTSIAQGTELRFRTTALGASSSALQMTIGANTGVTIGSPAGGAQGFGSLNAQTLYVGGVPIVPGGSGSGTVGSGTGPQLAQYPAGTGTTVAGVTLSGDATIAAGGALTIGAGRVTLAQMQSRGAATLLGNPTGGAGAPVEIPLGSGLAFSAGALTSTGGATGITGLTVGQIPIAGSPITITASANLSGDVVSAPTTLATTIQPGVVTHAKMVNVAASRLIGNPSPTTAGSRSEISLGTGLSFTGSVLNGAVGTLTSVGLTMPGSIFSVGGSPVTTGAGTLAVSVAGTSGGVPFFSSGTAMGTSGALAQHGVVIGGGPGNPPVTTAVGSAGQVLTGVTGGDPVWQAPPVGGVVASTLSTVPYYNTTATVTGNPNVTMTAGGVVTLNQSGSAALAVSTGPLQIVGAVNTGPWLEMYSFGAAAAGNYTGWAAGGTPASPTITASGSPLVALTGFGYTGSAYTGQRGSVQVITSEVWTTFRGTSVVINTTPTGGATFGLCATFNAGLTMAGATGAAAVAGAVNATGFYVNGVLLGTDTTAAVSAAGTTQGTATALTTQLANVTTVASGAGVVLPATPAAGSHCLVRNSGLSALLVYPAGTSQINTLGASVAISVLPNSTGYFEAMSTTQWFTVP
jgi:hypothetical protein